MSSSISHYCQRAPPHIVKAPIRDCPPTERDRAHPHHSSSQRYGTSAELCSQPPPAQLLPPTPARQLRHRSQGTSKASTAAHLRQRKQREQQERSPSRRHAGSTAPPPAFVSDRAGPGPFRTGYPSNPPRKFRPGSSASETKYRKSHLGGPQGANGSRQRETSFLVAVNEMANVGGGGGGAGKMAVRRGRWWVLDLFL